MTDDLLDFLKGWEGPPSLTVRRDPVASTAEREVFDIGYGHVCEPDHPPITLAQAEEMLREDVHSRAERLREFVPDWVPSNQFDALLSLAFNIGVPALRDSTLMRYVRQGDDDGAAFQFSRWNKSGGRIVNGLVKRRAAEVAIFLRGDYSGRP